ncbi:MAG: glycosyl hydrolase family 28-related protein [Methylococcales bacterium]|nr:glycosyl hydrolase family 28-related protein [Methylococcales bacterium]
MSRPKVLLLVLVAFALFSQFALANSPQVFWASDPVRPGETVLMTGEDLGSNPKISIRRLKDTAGDEDRNKQPVQLPLQSIQANNQSVKFELPSKWEQGIFEVTVGTEGGKVSRLINVPVVYWVQGEGGTKVLPGDWFRVFGRNIQAPGKISTIELKNEKTGKATQVKAESGSLWEAHFSIPQSLAIGNYTVSVNNGWGAKQGWVSAGEIHIDTTEPWPQLRFDVRKFGAIGNGIVDDTKAIFAAITEAEKNKGGIVFFPRGRYLIQSKLMVPRFVTLLGEGMDKVALVWADTDKPLPALIKGTNHFALREMAIYASNHSFIIEGDLLKSAMGEPGDVTIDHVRIRASKYKGHIKLEEADKRQRETLAHGYGEDDAIRLGGDNIRLTENDIYGSGRSLFLLKPHHAYIANNHFYNGRFGWYSITGADNVIFENNQITGADLMSSGGGINNLGGTAYSQDVYFANNRLELMFGWDREAMTSDSPGGLYYGEVIAQGENSIRLAGTIEKKRLNLRFGWPGAGVFILGGRGAGQFAQLAGIKGDIVTLDRKWAVQPDASSVITITQIQQNYLFINNIFSDAGAAIQYYGSSVNHVASGNRSERTSGFIAMGKWYYHYQPSWYCQFLDNEISDGNVYRSGSNIATFSGESILAVQGLQKAPNRAPLARGMVLRGNKLLSNAHIQLNGGSDVSAAGVSDVIVENNVVENSDYGIAMDRGLVNVYLKGNQLPVSKNK